MIKLWRVRKGSYKAAIAEIESKGYRLLSTTASMFDSKIWNVRVVDKKYWASLTDAQKELVEAGVPLFPRGKVIFSGEKYVDSRNTPSRVVRSSFTSRINRGFRHSIQKCMEVLERVEGKLI